MEKPTKRQAHMVRVRTIYRDARLSSWQRQLEAADVQRHLTALQIQRGISPAVLAAAQAEQAARTRLAARAGDNAAADSKPTLDGEAG